MNILDWLNDPGMHTVGWINDPEINTITACDYNTFEGETLKEKYEAIYVKMVELKNVLIAKAKSKGVEIDKFTINAGEFVAQLMDCSRTHCFGVRPSMDGDRPYLGKFFIGDSRWDVYWDKSVPRDKVIIESNCGKALLSIHNAPTYDK